ncbi:MAG: hypothetical protein LBQ66_10480 [Planctomycetaceae bacterium]|nr:hypothetical protein [Planctomycetaceae bacterium]
MIEEEDFNELIPSNLKFRSRIVLKIDVKTGKIQNWKSITSVDIFLKVTDNGIYKLYDENLNLLYAIHGYVPNELIPERDGFGDYITLNVNEDGLITNWYENPSIEDFLEEDDEDNDEEEDEEDDEDDEDDDN